MNQCRFFYTSLNDRSVTTLRCDTSTSHASGFCSRHANYRLTIAPNDPILGFLDDTVTDQGNNRVIQPYRGFAQAMIHLFKTHHLGPRSQCGFCNAFLWGSEAAIHNGRLTSTMCCGKGRLSNLPLFNPLPDAVFNLLSGSDPQSIDFQDNIRLYNSLLAPAWTKANIDQTLASRQGGFYCITTNGTISHVVSDLVTNVNEARFGQIWIFDSTSQLQRRSLMFPDVNLETLELLQRLMLQNNPHLREYQVVLELINLPNVLADQIELHLRPDYPTAASQFHPTAGELAAVIVGGGETAIVDRTVICRVRNSNNTGEDNRVQYHNIHPLGALYDPLSYPLIAFHGEPGWTPSMKDADERSVAAGKYYR